MSRDTQEPTVEERDATSGNRETVERHPAFAQIGAMRVSGGTLLYGSDFQHQHYIVIHIHRSKMHRHLSKDWPHAEERILEVALSEAQWATFVSSLNQGDGVPCTLQFEDGHLVPGLAEPKDRRQQFTEEIGERFELVNKALSALEQQIDQTPLSGKKKAELKRTLHTAVMNLEPNMDWVAKQFGEHMERTVEKAKAEVNAYAQHTLTNLAQQVGLPGGESPIKLLTGETEEETE